MTQQITCQYIQFTNGMVIGDTPLNLMIHKVIDWPERFSIEMFEKIILNYSVLGYEIIEVVPTMLPTGEMSVSFTIAKDYVYFSYS